MSKNRTTSGPQVALGTDASVRNLRPDEQKLIELSRRVGYGWLTNIAVRDGQLVFTPQPRARRKFRLGKPEAGRHTQPMSEDFKLKAHHLDLIERLRRVQNGMIVSIEVQDGLPVDLTLEEDVNV